MAGVRNKEGKAARQPIRPCDYFDLIAGTSTGGLIAAMLGVLRMDIDTCIETYSSMAPKVFPVEGILSGNKLGKLKKALRGEQRFDPVPLEMEIKRLVLQHLGDRATDGENTLMEFNGAADDACKVFVCVTSEKARKHFRFRSYRNPGAGDTIEDCPIWQACRATSAAPTYFPPQAVGKLGTTFVDGALGYDNPIRALIDEASRLWPGRPIACVLSLGTGLAPVIDVGSREFRQDMETRYPGKDVYFRFHVTRGLDTVDFQFPGIILDDNDISVDDC